MNKRLNNISLLRLFAILLIFAFHILYFSTDIAKQYFPLYFGVQIFLAISGFLYAQKTITSYKQFYIKNFLKILVPVVILLLFLVIMVLIVNPQNLTWGHFIEYISNGKYSLGHLWFVPIILLCYALLPFIQMASDKNHKHHKLGMVIISIVLITETVLIPICLQIAVLAYVIGFLLGKKYKNKGKTEFTKKTYGLVGLLLFFAGSLIYLFSKNNIYNISPALTYIQSCSIEIQTTIMATGVLLCVLCFLDFLNSKPTPKILKYSDKYGYYFYLFHHIFFVNTLSLLYLTNIIFLNSLIIFALTIICCFIFEFLSSKTIKLIYKLPFMKKNN